MTSETPKRRNGETPKGPLPATTDSPRHNDFSPVILAVASPTGRSARGIIRLSGQRAIDLLTHALDPFEMEAGARAVRLRWHDRSVPAQLLLAIAPRSYTGEHTAELQLPGNPALLPRVIDHLLALARAGGIDARRAQPGEFTARAYLNGRISLAQAEGVAATIAAQSDAELRAAHLLTTGRVGEFARSLADDLATALALVEAGIDFTDQEDVVAISPADLHARLTDLLDRLDRQLAAGAGAEQLRAIPWVVLRGRPNAGKSALFNALLGRERAVVSPIAGTTRDVLTEPLAIETSHGVAEVMLVDLAGLDDENDAPVDLLMQAAATEALQRAELILHCVPVGETDPDSATTVPRIRVRTKMDATPRLPPNGQRTTDNGPPVRAIHTSAITGEGLAELRAAIAGHLDSRAVSLAADALALSPRHSASFGDARQCLIESRSLLADHQADRSLPHPELIASTMRAALDCFSSIAGEMTPDDILGRVFSSFCVGK